MFRSASREGGKVGPKNRKKAFEMELRPGADFYQEIKIGKPCEPWQPQAKPKETKRQSSGKPEIQKGKPTRNNRIPTKDKT